MARIQQSIEVELPASALYGHLLRFEDYPQFLDHVESVRQVDDTTLHWVTKMGDRPVDWIAEITRKVENHCLAWHSLNGWNNDCRMEVQGLTPDTSKIIVTLDAEPGQFPGIIAGDRKDELEAQLGEALEKLKDYAEHGRASAQNQLHAAPPVTAASFSSLPAEQKKAESDGGATGDYKRDGFKAKPAGSNTLSAVSRPGNRIGR